MSRPIAQRTAHSFSSSSSSNNQAGPSSSSGTPVAHSPPSFSIGAGGGTGAGGGGGRGVGGRIRPPRTRLAGTNPDRERETLEKLGGAIKEIQRHNAASLSYEEKYAYNIVLRKKGQMLYDTISQHVADHLREETRTKLGVPFLAPNPIPQAVPTSSQTSPSKKEKSVAGGRGGAEVGGSGLGGGVGGVGGVGGSMIEVDKTTLVADGERFLKVVKEIWDDHVACMGKLRDVFKYLDKAHTKPQQIPSVWSLGLILFLRNVVKSTQYPILSHLISTLLTQIKVEREGDAVNRSAIRSCTEMLGQLFEEGGNNDNGGGGGVGVPRGVVGGMGGMGGVGVSIYKAEFEDVFLVESREFYEREAGRLLGECDAPEYLRRVERRLEEEQSRCLHYLHPSTDLPLTSILESTLISSQFSNILNHPSCGLDQMVEGDKVEDLRRLYKLFGRIERGNGWEELKKGIQGWIVGRGKKINEGVEIVVSGAAVGAAKKDGSVTTTGDGGGGEEGQDDDEMGGASVAKSKGKGKEKERETGSGSASTAAIATAGTNAAISWVQSVLDLKDKFDRLLGSAFGGDKAFQNSINKAFEAFVNLNSKSPEFISLFIDENLRKGLKGRTDTEVDVVLDKTITLFRFLNERDVFEKYYKQHLAKRLIQGRSVSDDAERAMLAKLKIECGSSFVSRMEGMLRDVKLSGEMATEYRKWVGRPGALTSSIDISVQVCTSSHWPWEAQPTEMQFPPDFQRAIQSFERFYLGRHQGRKITWRPEMGNVDVRIRFKARSHEVNMSTFAMVVLSLFEDLQKGDGLGYVDIRKATMMNDPDLKRTLQSLACAKYRVLNKEPRGRDVNDTDRFVFNQEFKCPLARFKIAMVANKVETQEELKETREKVEEERRLYTEACIVRTMKARKVLLYQELVVEVTKQLSSRFRPQPSHIKLGTEKLIEKEYLERDEKDRRKLKYLA